MFQNKLTISNCFVTGKWKDTEDANELLKLDEAADLSDNDSEIYGDFEDLETGEKHVHKEEEIKQGKKRKREDDNGDKKVDLAEKKRKLKERFDAEYDNTEKNCFYDDLKMSAEKQAQLNKTVFENVPDDIRVQIEGYRPGMYVRIEFQNVPSEFVDNFDPMYPLVIGALNIGEENIGYVNVKIKKHRWYSKILKANDPLIISLGWRRFQTIPLYSKLEDDLKFRYLKYTPEHLSCNGHFWGPITPQGTGFLALQVINSEQEVSTYNENFQFLLDHYSNIIHITDNAFHRRCVYGLEIILKMRKILETIFIYIINNYLLFNTVLVMLTTSSEFFHFNENSQVMLVAKFFKNIE